MIAWLWATALAAAPLDPACGPNPGADVDGAVAAIDKAFLSADEASFDRASKALDAGISCLNVVPTAIQVVRIHQAMALSSYVNGQIRACRRSLAAARLLDPSWKLTEDMFPGTHPYRDLFAAATDAGPVDDIGKITPDDWVVDGVVRDEAPTERAFLLQVEKGGAIVWSGYVWDFDEIPDRGQARVRSALETPHQWWVSGRVHGGGLFDRQTLPSGRDPAAWDEQSGSTFAGGADLVARYTPITVFGFEVGGQILGPADPVLGGGGLPSGHAVLLLGGADWVKGIQPYAAGRVGGELDRMRTWVPGVRGIEPRIYTVGLLVAGAELGVRTNGERIGLGFDGLVGKRFTAYGWKAQIDGGGLVAGPLALEGLVGFDRTGSASEDHGTVVGQRQELAFRVGGGVALWY